MTYDDFQTHVESYNSFLNKYLPKEGQGDNYATQVITCINRLVYEYIVNGDCLIFIGAVDNCIVQLDWLYDNFQPFRELCHKYKLNAMNTKIDTDEDYHTLVLTPLMDKVFIEEFYNEYCKIGTISNIYNKNKNGEFTCLLKEYNEERDLCDDD